MEAMIKDILSDKKYEFIHTNENLGKNIIYLTLSGSIGYGTNIGQSDIDLRGVAIEKKENIYGFQNFEQFEDGKTDTVIYSLKKFVSLAMKGNPNIIEQLGTREDHILYINEYGKRLRDNRQLFLSKRIIHTFGNYATAQLRRLQNALARDCYPQAEKERHILNTLNSQMKYFSDRYTSFPEGSIRLNIDKSNKESMDTEIYMDIHIDKYPVRDFVSIYSEISNIIREYEKLNHRNRKKGEDKLFKHAMHLIRLLIMGAEILETHEINTYREKEHELLMDIRQGKYSYEELFKMVEVYEMKFRQAAEATTLREEPDTAKAEQLLISIYEDYF
ncbi:nucleotidyltransferase domain-containing protein [Clostridium thermarum]|uniref:nucleotidyltransferase domain-containing protein n=1 Tax=Clostridium thermarum TaxID=1716543 RepID=UPI0015D663AC|nr:nucleotidyltransferase domain-containing protein [Clostridium thermarum]